MDIDTVIRQMFKAVMKPDTGIPRAAGYGSSLAGSTVPIARGHVMGTAVAVLLVMGIIGGTEREAIAARSAVSITVPLRFPLGMIERGIGESMFDNPQGTCTLVADEAGCCFFYLSRPQVSTRAKLLRIRCDASAVSGGAEAAGCANPQRWQGQIELSAQPQFDAGSRTLTLKTMEVAFYDAHHATTSAPVLPGDTLHKLIGERFEAVKIDCSPKIDRFAGLLAVLLPGGRERVDKALASLSMSKPRVFKFSVGVRLSFSVEPLPPDQRPVVARALERREERLQHWDSFVTFISKRLGRNRQQEQQHQVSNVLLDARYDLVKAQVSPETTSPDPVPGLFVRTWKHLRPVALHLSREGTPESGPDLDDFVTAGSLLAALSKHAEDLEYHVSDEGMRAVAHITDPDTPEDPLSYSTGVDLELRRLLGFGDPLPAPVFSPGVKLARYRKNNPLVSRWRALGEGGGSFMLPSAWAAEEPQAATRLNSWVPQKAELNSYLDMVKTLLIELREETLAKQPLGEQYARVYRDLVLATAWQESCWRQFVRKGDAIAPLVSSASSVGLMQVNPRVWRGVYDIEGLYGDIRYNGRAGCEILFHYLRDYAIAKGEDKLAGGIDNLPRSTYAIYNGGPGHRSRYRSATTSADLKKIDAALWQKYSAVREGREMEVAGCYK